MSDYRSATVSAVMLVAVIACGGRSKQENTGGGGAGANTSGAATTGPKGTALITGVVKFTGTPPANPPIDMSEEPKCAADYKTTPHEQVVVVNPNKTLAQVFVYVKSGIPAGATYPTPTVPVVLDQHGCRYHPRVFGIMVGQPLDIKNSDSLLHNIKAMSKKNRPFNISQPNAGMNATRTFTTEEVMLPFECNVHGWMHAWAGVLPYPFFSTTRWPTLM